MAPGVHENRLLESIPLDVTQSSGNEEHAFKKILNALLSVLLSWEGGSSCSSLYQNYLASFLAYVKSRIPFQVRSLSRSLSLMTSKDEDKDDEWFPQSVREQLEGSLSQRRAGSSNSGGDSLDTVLRYHSDQHSEISNSMLQMARTLKAQSLEANNIIKRDVKRLDEAKGSVENNVTALKNASDKMAACSKDGMNWCLIVLVIVVLMIFINMVLFMKVMKKNN